MQPRVETFRPAAVSVLLLLTFSSWARGGTCQPYQLALPWLGWLVLVCTILGPALVAQPHASRRANLRRACSGVLCDPVCWLGVLFLALLLVQWFNAGREQVYDLASQRWLYAPPRHPHWPSAVQREDAAEMLRWFFPAWALLLAIRSPYAGKLSIIRVLTTSALAAALLSLACCVQWLLSFHYPSIQAPAKGVFFTSFGYANHAGAYFLLGLCLSTGLLLRSIFRQSTGRRRLQRTLLSAGCVVLCFTAVHVSGSRASVLLAWIVMLVAAAYALFNGWPELAPVQRVDRALVVTVCAGLVFFAVHGTVRHAIERELSGLWPKGAKCPEHATCKQWANRLIFVAAQGERVTMRRTAWAIWRDYPWFGAGGWAQRYLMTEHTPASQWRYLRDPGRANTHCDIIQFLHEFGLVGLSLMLGSVAVVLWPVLRARRSLGPLGGFCLLGVALLAAYSSIDLPFRSPAVLYLWLLLAVTAGVLARMRVVGADKRNVSPVRASVRTRQQHPLNEAKRLCAPVHSPTAKVSWVTVVPAEA